MNSVDHNCIFFDLAHIRILYNTINNYMNLPSENVSVPPPSPFIEKAIANRLSVLPPNAEAIRHEAKGESSSTSSHGCDFIFTYFDVCKDCLKLLHELLTIVCQSIYVRLDK